MKGKFIIWYTVYCPDKKETELLLLCRQHFTKNAMENVFLLTCDQMRRYEGAWHMEQRPLFAGHVFLESENTEQLLAEQKGFGTPGTRLFSILPQEERFLRLLCGEDHHLGFSRGYIREGRTYVVEGPLRGMEAWIRKIDRHKRLARVKVPEMEILGVKETARECRELHKEICAGLEIVSKD